MKLYTVIFCLICFTSVTTAQSDLEKQLFELPDVIFKKIETPDGFKAAYELSIKQPLDHNDPTQGHFYQRVFLSHKSFDVPTALITNGYDRSRNNITEVARYLGTNQINVEHRYFGKSVPEKMDYQYLNFEQVTADFIRLINYLKTYMMGSGSVPVSVREALQQYSIDTFIRRM